jgi:hypothetical protein
VSRLLELLKSYAQTLPQGNLPNYKEEWKYFAHLADTLGPSSVFMVSSLIDPDYKEEWKYFAHLTDTLLGPSSVFMVSSLIDPDTLEMNIGSTMDSDTNSGPDTL